MHMRKVLDVIFVGKTCKFMEIDAWHQWVWLRPLFILLLIGLFVAVTAVAGWIKGLRQKRVRGARTARAIDGRRGPRSADGAFRKGTREPMERPARHCCYLV